MKLLPLILLAAIGSASAQDRSDYNLNDGKIRFSVPQDWSAIMEKSDGNPQAITFHVTDPAAEGTDDMASVTVKTRQLKSSADFADATTNEMLLSKAQTGYEAALDGSATGIHHYFVMRGQTRYEIRDRFNLMGEIAVQVRCQRPILKTTTKAWTSQFDQGCDSVANSLK
ncbi:MAG TPA: hypothetical protein VFN25_14445 [Dokdonella sp.]|uniref:hypothetical protein n=1 Tax=Dokdonella sp. TaxID=2291710 RepID=UPI002D7F73F7|nr:hypothetical protein [Dokdonella sp.]HET9034090.1 hypothetical protein [Dokdonella sp.]